MFVCFFPEIFYQPGAEFVRTCVVILTVFNHFSHLFIHFTEMAQRSDSPHESGPAQTPAELRALSNEPGE